MHDEIFAFNNLFAINSNIMTYLIAFLRAVMNQDIQLSAYKQSMHGDIYNRLLTGSDE
jgi:hypothetical protein